MDYYHRIYRDKEWAHADAETRARFYALDWEQAQTEYSERTRLDGPRRQDSSITVRVAEE